MLRARGAGVGVTVAEFYEEWKTAPEWVNRRGESTNLHNWERTSKFVERYGARAMRSIDDGVVVEWLRGGSTRPRFRRCGCSSTCSAPTRAFSAGPEIDGMRLDHVRRVCADPVPVLSASAGGRVDPDSLHRSNFTSFVYGTCSPRGDSGCPYPLEIQVWPACERSPSDYGTASPAGDLGSDEQVGSEVIEQTVVRKAPVKVYGNPGTSASAADDVPERAETVVGDSTVVVFTDGAAGNAAERARMLHAIAMLRPAGDSNAPTTGVAPPAAVMGSPLPALVPGALKGTLDCAS